METVTFQIKNSEKCLFGFNRPNSVVKTDLFQKKNSHKLILAICYSSTQSYFKIHVILIILFNSYFLYRKSSTFWVTDKEVPTSGQE